MATTKSVHSVSILIHAKLPIFPQWLWLVVPDNLLMWEHDQMFLDTRNIDVLPKVRSYGEIDEQNDENRIFLDSIAHTDNQKVDKLFW